MSLRPAIFRCLVVLLLTTGSAWAAEMSGPVQVIDGEAIDMEGVRFRLWGIGARESRDRDDITEPLRLEQFRKLA